MKDLTNACGPQILYEGASGFFPLHLNYFYFNLIGYTGTSIKNSFNNYLLVLQIL